MRKARVLLEGARNVDLAVVDHGTLKRPVYVTLRVQADCVKCSLKVQG